MMHMPGADGVPDERCFEAYLRKEEVCNLADASCWTLAESFLADALYDIIW